MPFTTLGLSPALLPAFSRALAEAGWTAPTPVQAQAIPLILAGHDLLAQAQTGSGKTAAFALPVLQRCAQARLPSAVQALVLVPTRELAVQIAGTLELLARHLPRRIKVVTGIGGGSINPQLMALRGGADIVVATPGRLLDLVRHHALRLDTVATLVLDEADRLLELGFGEELEAILALLPSRRQTLLFSATVPAATAALARRLLHAPREVVIDDAMQPRPAIVQRAIEVDAGRRTALLRHLIEHDGWPQVLVFVASQRSAENVAGKLRKAGLAAQALHGDLGPGRRAQVLRDFQANALQVLVATDVAARGLDVAALPLVVNYDLPRATVDYTHRIGRTARAGAHGTAISFVDAGSEPHLRLIEKRERVQVPRERVAGFEPTPMATPPAHAVADGTGGIKGRRPSRKDRLRAAAADHRGGRPG